MSDPFEISVDKKNLILTLRVWGFWSREEALCYKELLTDSIQSLEHPSWCILADVTMFPIQTSFVQSVHSDLMQFAVLNGLVRSANIVGNALTRIQIDRLSSSIDSGKGRFAFFKTEEDARKWLEEVTYERSEAKAESLFQTV